MPPPQKRSLAQMNVLPPKLRFLWNTGAQNAMLPSCSLQPFDIASACGYQRAAFSFAPSGIPITNSLSKC